MTLDDIEKIRGKLDRLWNRIANIYPSELIRVSESVGRRLIKQSRKHLTYKSPLDDRPDLRISGHPGTMDVGWAKDVIKILSGDLDKLEELEMLKRNNLKKGGEDDKDIS